MSILRFLRSQLLVSPPQQTFDFSNQVVVVTGGNNGLGFEAARQLLASNVARVIITVRSHEKGKRAVQELWSEAGQNERVGYQLLDMASYKSVLEFSECLAKLPRLDAVVLNAGFATTDFALVEGSESTITVNVISTMLLAANVVPILRSSANENGTLGRICVVTSDTHEFATIETEQKTDSIFDPLNKVETARMDERYFVSKLLEIFAVRAMASLLVSNPQPQPMVICAVNPGLCHSSLTDDVGGWQRRKYAIMKALLARSTADGARNYIQALSLGWACNGKYVSDYEINDEQLSAFVRSQEGIKAQARVWDELAEKLNEIRPGVIDALTSNAFDET